jgi:formate dehydrogenase subunit gamma
MRQRLSALAGMLAALVLAVGLAVATPAAAQQPTSVNPTASSVKEEQLFRQLNAGAVSGRITIPDDRAGVLIQPAGQSWRSFHQGTLLWIGALAILGMAGVLAVFYAKRGKIRIEAGPAGVRIKRFNAFERFTHWLTATCFIVLALSGLNITFGKYVLMPVFGPEVFATVSQLGKYAHNFLAFPFMAGLVLMLLIWIKDNLPAGGDLAWLKAGGGLIGHGHPPARKFNAGQKLIFWSVILGGAALSVSGVLLLFPFQGTDIAGMQLAAIVHGVVSVVLVAIMIAHIYIGSVGMEGAFDAMGSGEVDLNWAKEHHSLWVAESQAKSGGRVQPAE